MEVRDQIVRRMDSGRREDVHVVGATLWPTEEERLAETLGARERIEVSMLPPSTRLVRTFPLAGLERQYLRHLEQRIARRPRDLKSHVSRVLTYAKLDDDEGATGALADLFLVLGDRGLRLRTRLFRLVEARLTRADRALFGGHLETGLAPTEAMPALPRSRLSQQIGGTTAIVIDGDDSSTSGMSLARKLIAEGRDDEAQQVLEGLLESDPGEPEVSEALLDLYEQKNLRESFFRTYARFLGRPLGRMTRWRLAASRFAQGTSRPTDLPDLAHLT